MVLRWHILCQKHDCNMVVFVRNLWCLSSATQSPSKQETQLSGRIKESERRAWDPVSLLMTASFITLRVIYISDYRLLFHLIKYKRYTTAFCWYLQLQSLHSEERSLRVRLSPEEKRDSLLMTTECSHAWSARDYPEAGNAIHLAWGRAGKEGLNNDHRMK